MKFFYWAWLFVESKNKINAARKVTAVTAVTAAAAAATAAAAAAAATAAAAAAAAAIATSNVANISISSSASTLINGNKVTASFELTPPPSFYPSTTSSLPSSNDETRASLDINSLSDQSSILASFTLHKRNHCQL
jgi:hypothetical protein